METLKDKAIKVLEREKQRAMQASHMKETTVLVDALLHRNIIREFALEIGLLTQEEYDRFK